MLKPNYGLYRLSQEICDKKYWCTMKLIWIPLPRDVSGGQRDKKKPWCITSMYSILFNKMGGWNICGYGAKFSEMIINDPCLYVLRVSITFGWVQQQSNSKSAQKWWQKCSRNVQLIRGSFGKEILLIKSIL